MSDFPNHENRHHGFIMEDPITQRDNQRTHKLLRLLKDDLTSEDLEIRGE